jgi:dTDP-4-amino-4,6-dideoxygalactose transaminase
VVKDEELAAIVPSVRHNGHGPYERHDEDYWLPAMSNVVMPIAQDQFVWPANHCLNEISCLAGQMLLRRIDQMNNLKRVRAIRFIDCFTDVDELIFHREDSERHNYHLLVAKVTGVDRDALIRSLYKRHGVQCAIQYMPLYRYDLYRKAGFGEANVPVTDAFYDAMISFPFQQTLSDAELDYVIDVTRSSVKALR